VLLVGERRLTTKDRDGFPKYRDERFLLALTAGEQLLMDRPLDTRTDIWSLGLVLFVPLATPSASTSVTVAPSAVPTARRRTSPSQPPKRDDRSDFGERR